MKKILLLSDTHGYVDDHILNHAKKSDEIWHAGDIGTIDVVDALAKIKPLRAVYGNIDDSKIRGLFPLHNRFRCEEVTVWMTHIGGYPGRYNPAIKKELQLNTPRLFICGHSHILKVMSDKKLNLIHMNPGAIGKHGYHKVRTMLRFEIDGKEIRNLEVIEVKR